MRKLDLLPKKCPICGKLFGRETCRRVSDFKEKVFCSRKCYFRNNVGENHWYWKGGFKTRPDGYIRDSKTDKYIHRIVMEKYLGRKLLPTEHIHHIDKNPKNNEINNLLIISHSEHAKLENKFRKRNKKGYYLSN